MKRLKVLSQHGPSAHHARGMTEDEARAYHHVFDEPDSDDVVLTWPRTIPMREGDRGWADMAAIQRRLPELRDVPTLLLWAPGDNVFPDRVRRPAEGASAARRRTDCSSIAPRIFCRTIAGRTSRAAIVEFLERSAGSRP